MMFRPLAVMVVVIVVAASNPEVGLAAGAVYALAYARSRPVAPRLLRKSGAPMKRALAASLSGLALTLPTSALASTVEATKRREVRPLAQWLLHELDPHPPLGPRSTSPSTRRSPT